MRLNKSTSHAIRILIDCAKAGDSLVKVADLSARLGITMQNVFKIVHILSRAELLVAVRGRNGGVRLARPAFHIRIGDVVRAMEATEIEIGAAGSGPSRGRENLIGINRVFDDALEAFVAVLDKHTLADMARRPDRASQRRAHKRPVHRRKPVPLAGAQIKLRGSKLE
ncbi:MAG TPA: Rrf2 family transcriptional regulator [Hyphomicrobiaceae bacterium]|jgi:Rrf2 family nitric oxide-sensitive transcriptional repressor|nr:Rrf2 family transcriptional regulator [Hyphomicrobiaceae bacterium]